MDKLKNVNFINSLYRIIFNITLSLSILQFTCPIVTHLTNFRFDYLGILLLGIIFLMHIYLFSLKNIFLQIKMLLYPTRYLIIALLVYFLYDFFTLLYANNLLLLVDKYQIWLKIAIVCFFMIYYMTLPQFQDNKNKDHVNDLLLNLGITGLVASITSLIGYYSGTFTFRAGILTPISNHNIFAMSLLFAFIALSYYLLFIIQKSIIRKLISFIIISFFYISAIYLSGSRRAIILLIITLLIISSIFLYSNKQYFKKINYFFTFFVLIFLLYFSVNQHIIFFNNHINNVASILEAKESVAIGSIGKVDTIDMKNIPKDMKNIPKDMKNIPKADDYYTTIANGTGLNTRIIIWEASVNWFNDMSTFQKIFGGGGSYSFDVFDKIKHPYNQKIIEHYKSYIQDFPKGWMWPHNFLLEDLLAGGIIKLIIVLIILIYLLIYTLKLYRINKIRGLLFFNLYLVLLASLMLGGKHGFFGDRNTWLLLSLHISTVYSCLKQNNRLKKDSF